MPHDPFLNLSQDQGGPPMPRLQAGQMLFNRCYELIRQLGAGGMGVVWLARDHTEEAEVALKFLPTVLVLQEGELKRLKEEVRAGKELRHPHIVATYGLEVEGSTAAIVMEHVQGWTLKEHLEKNERGFFEPGEIVSWVRNIAEAVDYLHGKAKRIHRDLKPANIIVDAAGEARLMDFGISQRITESVTRHSKTSEGKSGGGGSSSTLAYASPQQLSGKPGDKADDIYSLGAMLYELLTGTPPFFRGDAHVVGFQIATQPVTPIMERRAELVAERLYCDAGMAVTPPVQMIVTGCLAKEREKRPPTCAKILSALTPGNQPKDAQPAHHGSAYSGILASDLEELGQLCSKLMVLPVSPAGNWAERMREGVDVQRSLNHPYPSRFVASSATLAAGAVYERRRDIDGVLVCFEVRQQEVIGSIVEVGDGVIAEKFTHAIPICDVMPGNLWPSLSQAWKNHGYRSQPIPSPNFNAVVPATPMLAAHAEVLRKNLPGKTLIWKDTLPAALKGASMHAQACEGRETGVLFLFVLYRSLVIMPPTGDSFHAFPAFTTIPLRKTFQTRCSADVWGRGEFQLLEDSTGAGDRLKLHTFHVPPELTTRDGAKIAAALQLEVCADGSMHLTAEAPLEDPKKTSPKPPPKSTPPAAPSKEKPASTSAPAPSPKEKPASTSAPAPSPKGKPASTSAPAPGPKEKPASTSAPLSRTATPPCFLEPIREEDAEISTTPLKGDNLDFEVSSDGSIHITFGDPVSEGALFRKPVANKDPRSSAPAASWATAYPPAGVSEAASLPPSNTHPANSPKKKWPLPLMCLAIILSIGWSIKSGTERPGALDYAIFALSAASFAFALVAAVKAQKRRELGLRSATVDSPFTNSLGMKFVPLGTYDDGKVVMFSIWETRSKDYAAFMKSGVYTMTGSDAGHWKTYEYKSVPVGRGEGEKAVHSSHPVQSVSHDDAVAFCGWLTKKDRVAGLIGPQDEYRLPSDVEWSHAVGIGDKEDTNASPKDKDMGVKDAYPWGGKHEPGEIDGNYADTTAREKGTAILGIIEGYTDGHATTAPVGSFKKNERGLYDLGGNVWEWTNTFWETGSTRRVLRGASWRDGDAFDTLSSYRYCVGPSVRNFSFGFRCVLVVGGG